MKSEYTDNLQTWINTTYLYEESLFVYSIINFIWYFIGRLTMGFSFSVFSDLENLFIHLLWCIVLWIALCFPDFWYRLFFKKKEYLFKEEKKIQEKLYKLQDVNAKEQMIYLLREKGKLPMNRKQQTALGFLFMVPIFDIFFSSIWVNHRGILIWQPDWVIVCIDWVKSHLNLPPIYQDRDIFNLDFGDDRTGRILKQEFGDEFLFLQNPISNTLLFYHFIRVMLFIPIITALCIIIWQPLQAMGNSDKDPSNINSIMDFIRASAWSIVMAFFGIIGTFILINDVETYINFIRTGEDSEIILGLYLFITISVRFFAGWIVFWKRVFKRFLGVLS